MTVPARSFAILDRADDGARGLRGAAAAAGLQVVALPADPREAEALLGPGAVLRAPGGYLAVALQLGAGVVLSSGTPEWFCALDPELTGRSWRLVTPAEALALVEQTPCLVKLADGKHPGLPARRHDATSLGEALRRVHADDTTQLLTTPTWLDIHSEYRVFTVAREATTCSPYLVEDELFSPQLRWHRASFHDAAGAFAARVLEGLAEEQVPPASVIDVARLADGRFVVLEANNPWSSGLYSCAPDAALRSLVAASEPASTGPGDRWRWRPDRSVFNPRWARPAS